MSIEAIDDGPHNRRLAIRELLATKDREIAMLRKALEDNGFRVFATTACNICYRDVPHSSDVHEADTARAVWLPNFDSAEWGIL